MCEMLGISARRRLPANAILREFFSHAEQHPHGWGLARFSERGVPSVEKEPVKATASAYLKHRLDWPIEEHTLLAHIRLATVGTMEYANCHPFVCEDNRGRTWTLVHNGTVFNGNILNGYMGIQFGDTDSERVLIHLVEQINLEQIRLHRALGETERFALLSEAIADIADGNKLNLLIFDGEVMYAHTNFRDSLHMWRQTESVLFSTRPLSVGTWEEVPFTRLVAVRAGEVVREGESHGREYIYNPEDYRFVYMNFARL